MNTILITGTSQGIGHALTKLLLFNGYRVIGTNTTGIDNINENNYKSFALDLSNLDSITAFENNFQNNMPEPMQFLIQSDKVILSGSIRMASNFFCSFLADMICL